ncbi:MAG: hypothetical protein O3B13_05330 [Planctomycetota bacterium]|nr:hypothetical protein [Planctomycetota bacterium]MDA1162499.1 hypothetical protein [Planctomycetota bacterium]
MMTAFFVLAVAQNTSWYVFPLAAAISLVYSASRYELTERVIKRAIRLFVTIIGFMFIVLVILWLLSANL